MMYETGLTVATVWNQPFSIRSRGRAIELRNRKTNSSGNAPWTASALPVRRPIVRPTAPNAIETRQRERDQDQRAADAGLEVGAEREPDREETDGLDDPEQQRSRELAADQRGAAEGRELQAVEEAALDVLGDRLAGAHRREQRALHEGDGEEEGEVGVGGEARQVGGGRQPGRVDREQEEREDHARDDHRGLAHGAHDRAPSEVPDLDQGAGALAGERGGDRHIRYHSGEPAFATKSLTNSPAPALTR